MFEETPGSHGGDVLKETAGSGRREQQAQELAYGAPSRSRRSGNDHATRLAAGRGVTGNNSNHSLDRALDVSDLLQLKSPLAAWNPATSPTWRSTIRTGEGHSP
jgi:hypothetical protein